MPANALCRATLSHALPCGLWCAQSGASGEQALLGASSRGGGTKLPPCSPVVTQLPQAEEHWQWQRAVLQEACGSKWRRLKPSRLQLTAQDDQAQHACSLLCISSRKSCVAAFESPQKSPPPFLPPFPCIACGRGRGTDLGAPRVGHQRLQLSCSRSHVQSARASCSDRSAARRLTVTRMCVQGRAQHRAPLDDALTNNAAF